jgi:hypothetical protein
LHGYDCGARLHPAAPQNNGALPKEDTVLAHLQRVPQIGVSRIGKEDKVAARFTVSLPVEIAEYLRSRAEELSEPVSGFVAETIRWRQEMELENAMVQGLLEDAERDQELAADWSATLPDLPE